MVRMLKPIAIAGALVFVSLPASAAIVTLPFVGDIENPDMDPFHLVTPEAPPAAPAAPKKMKHHKMKKKMMKKKM